MAPIPAPKPAQVNYIATLQYAARVVVKRVFKGGGGLRSGSRVVIDGLGNPNICVSRPRLGDAREGF